MAKNGLETKVSLFLQSAIDQRRKRNVTSAHKAYQRSLIQLNEILRSAINESSNNPEIGIAVARRCSRLVLEGMPDLAQDPARANVLRQYETLEHHLSLVRQPGLHLGQIQAQFGPTLDPRSFGGGDAFNTTIKSQKQRLYAEGQGFNTQDERDFCRLRSELLTAVEKAYNRLRDQALGLSAPENRRGLGR